MFTFLFSCSLPAGSLALYSQVRTRTDPLQALSFPSEQRVWTVNSINLSCHCHNNYTLPTQTLSLSLSLELTKRSNRAEPTNIPQLSTTHTLCQQKIGTKGIKIVKVRTGRKKRKKRERERENLAKSVSGWLQFGLFQNQNRVRFISSMCKILN